MQLSEDSFSVLTSCFHTIITFWFALFGMRKELSFTKNSLIETGFIQNRFYSNTEFGIQCMKFNLLKLFRFEIISSQSQKELVIEEFLQFL